MKFKEIGKVVITVKQKVEVSIKHFTIRAQNSKMY